MNGGERASNTGTPVLTQKYINWTSQNRPTREEHERDRIQSGSAVDPLVRTSAVGTLSDSVHILESRYGKEGRYAELLKNAADIAAERHALFEKLKRPVQSPSTAHA